MTCVQCVYNICACDVHNLQYGDTFDRRAHRVSMGWFFTTYGQLSRSKISFVPIFNGHCILQSLKLYSTGISQVVQRRIELKYSRDNNFSSSLCAAYVRVQCVHARFHEAYAIHEGKIACYHGEAMDFPDQLHRPTVGVPPFAHRVRTMAFNESIHRSNYRSTNPSRLPFFIQR